MNQQLKKIVSIMITLTIILELLAGCAKDGGNTKVVGDYEEFLTIDVFCTKANYQGLQSGWFAKVVKDKFNMELNIIAPNVAGGGDTLFQTRSAAGNLGDIVMIGADNGRLLNAIQAELVYDISELIKDTKYLVQHHDALAMIQNITDKTDRVYAIPSGVSSSLATSPSEGLEFNYGPYIRWDYYNAIGAPKLSTLEDLLPVLKKMQDMFPTSDSGAKSFAISLFKDWDDNMMTLAKQPTCFYGYDEVGFLLNKADGTDIQAIIESDSQYVRALNFYYQANQLGILDPESSIQNWDTVFNKYVDGAILFSPWPWLGQSAYNTMDHKNQGKGFMLAPVSDMEIYSYGATPTGTRYVVGVGSKAQEPKRMMDFIDWLYSPEGIMMSSPQTGGACGPEGLTWEMVNGRPELTEFGIKAFMTGEATMPETWGGGSWSDGVSQLNFTAALPSDMNPESQFPYSYTLWDSVIEMSSTELDLSWQEVTGSLSTRAYLDANNQYIVAPGTDYIPPAEPSEISTLRAQCKAIIIEKSWKMIYAADDAEFVDLLKEMQDTVYDLGYRDVLAFDMQTATDLNRAREIARNKYK